MSADVTADFAAFWWSLNSGETETWDELDADEREAVIEHGSAEAVAECFEERMAVMEEYVGKIPGYYVELSAEAACASAEEFPPLTCEDRGCKGGRTHQGTTWKSGYREEQWAPCGRPCDRRTSPQEADRG